MQAYAFELSGEHPTLPRSEALALVRVYASSWHELLYLDQCLIVEACGADMHAISRRLALSHSIICVLSIMDASAEGIAEGMASIALPYLPYRVRARSVRSAGMSGQAVEQAIGRELFRRGLRADLKHPSLDLRAIITTGKIVFGYLISSVDRSSFEARRPHLKQFFYPGVLMPRTARALVNMTCIREDERLLDPFAGTGGILVEACLAGARSVGVDVQEKLARGAKCNVCGMNCTIIAGDARRLPIKDESIDAVVTDPPYGRSAVIRAESKEELLDLGLREIHRVLRPGRLAVVVADRLIDDLIMGSGLKIVEKHSERVHRSLTRQIFVCSA
jgi:tRNA (guanine10-N2)-dimethyltransferase